MTPIYLNPPSSPFPPKHNDFHDFLLSTPSHASSTSSSLSCRISFDTSQDQVGSYEHQEANKNVLHGESSDQPHLTMETDIQSDHQSVKWMSSKMRLMKKMLNSDRTVKGKNLRSSQKFQDQPNQFSNFDNDKNSSNNTAIRTCSDCNTTKTPLWRSGPRGPKSLCNACGIRQRKARRALAAAAAAGTLISTETPVPKVVHREKRSGNGAYIPQYKKRCKITVPPSSQKKLCFEDLSISLSKSSAFHRVFPQDEREAAVLLMALSCGLVHV
ncbi:hypothetical protein GIB67_026367 [Kingdonia uniflora]|uniref:GATA-type domain-containing protein n=1 Tax=Kingdonia uniflora TaxID=39325 RepID=A0A7J7P606_9MAGN|nr:hypothetical protein GIB67_026367 [Kingdonia uniflora]